ncbi:MAG: hypothetical protein IKN64_11300 [Desulfovibrio sp.]|nr:hypothetical protein [Desulfovibrio sp.]
MQDFVIKINENLFNHINDVAYRTSFIEEILGARECDQDGIKLSETGIIGIERIIREMRDCLETIVFLGACQKAERLMESGEATEDKN